MNKKYIVISIGLFWVVLIVGFIAMKEFTLKTGKTVLLKTVPVDPRDLFRGDYVILNYDISSIDVTKFSKKISDFQVGDNIYASLIIDQSGAGSISGIGKAKPSAGLFLKGKITRIRLNVINVSYGIESYFVPEGKGREVEKQIRSGMYIRVAIDNSGKAVIDSLVASGNEVKEVARTITPPPTSAPSPSSSGRNAQDEKKALASIKSAMSSAIPSGIICLDTPGAIFTGGPGGSIQCRAGEYKNNWPIIPECGPNPEDTQWIVKNGNTENWEVSLMCKNFTNCNGEMNASCDPNGCFFKGVNCS